MHIKDEFELEIIEDAAAEAYRQYLKDPAIDYQFEVEKESNQARKSLWENAKRKGLSTRIRFG